MGLLLPFGIQAGEGHAIILEIPGLVAFWDFQEGAGNLRISKGGSEAISLTEQKGPVERVGGGLFGGHAAKIRRGQWLMTERKDIGELDIHGENAEVTVIAWIKRLEKQSW